MTRKIPHFFRALKEAEKSKSPEYKIGAVISKGKRVLSTGYNSTDFCSLNKHMYTRHAEMDAINFLLLNNDSGLSSLKNATITIVRKTKLGTGLAKPCSLCADLIKKVGIKRIYYSENQP